MEKGFRGFIKGRELDEGIEEVLRGEARLIMLQ